MCQPYNHKLSFEVTLLNLPNFMTLIALLPILFQGKEVAVAVAVLLQLSRNSMERSPYD
jgi:hypothetical protein